MQTLDPTNHSNLSKHTNLANRVIINNQKNYTKSVLFLFRFLDSNDFWVNIHSLVQSFLGYPKIYERIKVFNENTHPIDQIVHQLMDWIFICSANCVNLNKYYSLICYFKSRLNLFGFLAKKWTKSQITIKRPANVLNVMSVVNLSPNSLYHCDLQNDNKDRVIKVRVLSASQLSRPSVPELFKEIEFESIITYHNSDMIRQTIALILEWSVEYYQML